MRIGSWSGHDSPIGGCDINHGGKAMTTKKSQRLLVVIAALFVLSLSVNESAWARGDRDGAGHRGFSGGVLQQLIFPCPAECRDSAQDCVEAAEGEGISCIQTACATQIQAAQTACATDRTAQVCKDAVSALRTCGDSCITTLQTGTSACRDTQESCREACDLVQ